MAETWNALVAPIEVNRGLLRRLLGSVGPCRCRARRAWWGRMRRVEHTVSCQAQEAFRVELELALALAAEAIDSPSQGTVDAFKRQMDDALTAGHRAAAAIRAG